MIDVHPTALVSPSATLEDVYLELVGAAELGAA